MNTVNPRIHKDLLVWQQSLDLAEQVYVVTDRFPARERFGITQQMRRAGVSVLSNIAEGAARRTSPDFLNFLYIARASLAELDSQVALSSRLGSCAEAAELQRQIERVGQLLGGLIAFVQRRMRSS